MATHLKLLGSELAVKGSKCVTKCGVIVPEHEASLDEDEVTCHNCRMIIRAEHQMGA